MILELGIWFLPLTLFIAPWRRLVSLVAKFEQIHGSLTSPRFYFLEFFMNLERFNSTLRTVHGLLIWLFVLFSLWFCNAKVCMSSLYVCSSVILSLLNLEIAVFFSTFWLFTHYWNMCVSSEMIQFM